MHNYKKIFSRVIAIAILLFAIYSTASQFLDLAFSDSAYLSSTDKIMVCFEYVNFVILLGLGILNFFSRHSTIFIIDTVLCFIGIVFWLLDLEKYNVSTNLTNVAFLVVVLVFNCWQFIANRSAIK